MKKILSKTLCMLFASSLFFCMKSGMAYAQIPVCADAIVIGEYPAPVEFASVHGIAFDGKNIWAANYGVGKVHKMGFDDNNNAVIVDTMTTPTNSPTGLTFIGKKIVVATDADLGEGRIVSFLRTRGKKSGQVVTSFVAPGEDSVGLTFDGEFLYNADFNWSMPYGAVHKLKPKGDLVASYYFQDTDDWERNWNCPEGLAYDGQDLWLAELCQNRVYQLDITDLSPICYFEGPGYAPIGLTFVNGYLWLADQVTSTFYQIDVGQ